MGRRKAARAARESGDAAEGAKQGAQGEEKKLLRSHTARYIDPGRYGCPAKKPSRALMHPKFVHLRSLLRHVASYVRQGAVTVAQWEELCTLWMADSVQRYPAVQRDSLALELDRLSEDLGAQLIQVPIALELVANAEAENGDQPPPARVSSLPAAEDLDPQHVHFLLAAGFCGEAVHRALAAADGCLYDAVASLLLQSGARPVQGDQPLARAPSWSEEARLSEVADERLALEQILGEQCLIHSIEGGGEGGEGFWCTLRLEDAGGHSGALLDVLIAPDCQYPMDAPMVLVRGETLSTEQICSLTLHANERALSTAGSPIL